MEMEKIRCPGCGQELNMGIHEFVDVEADPELKEQIMTGELFLVKCPDCGEETLAEYPVMYMDPAKKLNIYMAPGHDEDLLMQLNSLDMPEAEVDNDAVFRVVESGEELLEKILIFDRGRDDRILELYKAIIVENIKDEWPDVHHKDILYFTDEDEDYFIIWNYANLAGEQLTVNLDEEMYAQLRDNYLPALGIPAGEYAEVNEKWLAERIDVEP